MFTSGQVAKAAGVSTNTIYANSKKDGYPRGIMKNRRLYFTKKDMDFFVKACAQYKISGDIADGLENGTIKKQEAAAKFLGVSGQTLSLFQNRSEEPIPCIKKKNCILYKLSDLQEFLDSGRSVKKKKRGREEDRIYWSQKRKQTSDPKKDTMIKPLKVPKHKCSRPECNIMTTNKFLCDKCKAEFAGECGDNFYSPPTRRTGMRGE